MESESPFHSILFARADSAGRKVAPETFHDLQLGPIVATVTVGRDEYRLSPFFEMPLKTLEAVAYRHEVFRDLENRALRLRIASFAEAMRTVRSCVEQSMLLHYRLQQERWLLDALTRYCEASTRLAEDLRAAPLQSRGLICFRDSLRHYVSSESFGTLSTDAKRIGDDLAALRYGLHVDGGRIEVRRYEGEPDYSHEVALTFAKFAEGGVREYRFRLHDYPEMNHVEEAILERVAQLFPQPFSALSAFCAHHRSDFDPLVQRFDREIQFYLAYLEYIEGFTVAGLPFCYPEVTDRAKDVRAEAMFDLALAGAFAGSRRPSGEEKQVVVTNDFALDGAERILVVTGANQGGKTTFARAFGQLHYLASLGCSVPARHARLFLFDALYTHFEREESVETLAGKLEEELLRMHRILESATSRSVLVMNESFGATTLDDALFLAERVLRQVIERDILCVCVTFLDELASLDRATVSMVSQVDPSDPSVRTFKVVREPANGLAHALAIAKKYRLGYQDVRERAAS